MWIENKIKSLALKELNEFSLVKESVNIYAPFFSLRFCSLSQNPTSGGPWEQKEPDHWVIFFSLHRIFHVQETTVLRIHSHSTILKCDWLPFVVFKSNWELSFPVSHSKCSNLSHNWYARKLTFLMGLQVCSSYIMFMIAWFMARYVILE